MDTPFFDVEKFTVPKAGMAAFQSQLVLLTEDILAHSILQCRIMYRWTLNTYTVMIDNDDGANKERYLEQG